MQKERSWTDNNRNRYYELLNSLFNRAIKWKRLKVNPVVSIDKKVGAKKKFEVRMEEGIEDRLIAACEELNRPQHKPHSKLLTWEKVEELRNRVAAGESQKAVAGAQQEAAPAASLDLELVRERFRLSLGPRLGGFATSLARQG